MGGGFQAMVDVGIRRGARKTESRQKQHEDQHGRAFHGPLSVIKGQTPEELPKLGVFHGLEGHRPRVAVLCGRVVASSLLCSSATIT